MSRSFKLIAAAIVAASVAGAAHADTFGYDAALANGVYYGSGNPNAGFSTLTMDNGVELGLGVNLRFVGPVIPSPVTGSTYYVPTGTSGGLALWNIEYSVDYGTSGLNPGNTHALLTVINLANSQQVQFNPDLVGDNAHNGVSYQNSENLSFAFVATFWPAFAFNPNVPNSFDVMLSLSNADNVPLGTVSELINAVTPTPIPAALPLFAGGLGVIGLLARRRKQKSATAA